MDLLPRHHHRHGGHPNGRAPHFRIRRPGQDHRHLQRKVRAEGVYQIQGGKMELETRSRKSQEAGRQTDSYYWRGVAAAKARMAPQFSMTKGLGQYFISYLFITFFYQVHNRGSKSVIYILYAYVIYICQHI